MSCCKICQKDIINCLANDDELILNIGGLVHGEVYFAVFTNNNGKAYVIPFTYDGTTKTGVVPIGSGDNELPASVLNSSYGDLQLTIQDTIGHCMDFNYYAKTDCIDISIVDYSGAYAKNEVGLPIVSADQIAPTVIEFENETGLVIPYTIDMLASYGNVPTVKAWILTAPGVYTETVIGVSLDGNPPSNITLDFGGAATGFVKIS